MHTKSISLIKTFLTCGGSEGRCIQAGEDVKAKISGTEKLGCCKQFLFVFYFYFFFIFLGRNRCSGTELSSQVSSH